MEFFPKDPFQSQHTNTDDREIEPGNHSRQCDIPRTDRERYHDSDEEMDDWFAVSDAKIFDYRTALNGSVRRPETASRLSVPGVAAQTPPVQPQLQRVASSGNAG